MKKQKLLKATKILVALVLVFAILVAFVVENVLPYSGIKPFRMIPAENAWRFPRGYAPENYDLAGIKINIPAKDGVNLSGWFLSGETNPAKATVIILHGIGACKETQFERAKILTQQGYNSVVLDLRAHGESGGDYCTFGYHEKYDIQAVVDSVLPMTGGKPVGIWGASLGGAVALQAMELDQRIAFGVIESTFDEFEKVAMEYGADMMFGLKSKWLTNRVLNKSGNIARFDPQSVKPVVSAAAIHRPVLFMHGDRDNKIPIEFNLRNYNAVQSDEKQWITVKNAGHNNLWHAQGSDLKVRVLTFLQQAIAP
ncbi:MAG: alpha/beta fold hydrolase [Lewinellaceae bacterium]|nr:alpha/beta fold hydrolase [Lewinellaceae bacterium]